MDRLKMLALRLLRDEEGQDLIEYALLATFVSLVAIAGASLLGTALNNWYDSVGDRVDGFLAVPLGELVARGKRGGEASAGGDPVDRCRRLGVPGRSVPATTGRLFLGAGSLDLVPAFGEDRLRILI